MIGDKEQDRWRLVSVKKSTRPDKKLAAKFTKGERMRTVHFGAKGMSDYTLHHDKQRRERYRERHKNDRLEDPLSPGALSWYLLWGDSTSLEKNIDYFKRKFRLI